MFSTSLGMVRGAYALLAGGLAGVQRDLIYHPTLLTGTPAQAGVPEMSKVDIVTRDGLVLSAWHAAAAQGRPTVVLCHGNAANLSHRAPKARVLLDAGLGVLLVGYRGYGGNPGRPSEAGLCQDGRAHLDWLSQQGVCPADVVLMGESLGTGVAIQLAVEYGQVAGLVLESPFISLPDLAPPPVLPAMADLVMVDRYDNLGKIGQVSCPILMLHGEQDGVVPASHARRLAAAAQAPQESIFYPRGGHHDLWDLGAGQSVVHFILALSGR